MRTRAIVVAVLSVALLASPLVFGGKGSPDQLSPIGPTTKDVIVFDNGSLQIVQTFRLEGRDIVLIAQTETWYIDTNNDGAYTPGDEVQLTQVFGFGQ